MSSNNEKTYSDYKEAYREQHATERKCALTMNNGAFIPRQLDMIMGLTNRKLP